MPKINEIKDWIVSRISERPRYMKVPFTPLDKYMSMDHEHKTVTIDRVRDVRLEVRFGIDFTIPEPLNEKEVQAKKDMCAKQFLDFLYKDLREDVMIMRRALMDGDEREAHLAMERIEDLTYPS